MMRLFGLCITDGLERILTSAARWLRTFYAGAAPIQILRRCSIYVCVCWQCIDREEVHEAGIGAVAGISLVCVGLRQLRLGPENTSCNLRYT